MMLDRLYRYLRDKIYKTGQVDRDCELPEHLSLRELADIPPYHPSGRCAEPHWHDG